MSATPPTTLKRPRVELRRTTMSSRDLFRLEEQKCASDDDDERVDAQRHASNTAITAQHCGFFDEEAPHTSGEVEELRAVPRGRMRVGLGLLRAMHRSSPASPSSPQYNTTTEAQVSSTNMQVVEAYTPLSVGGFMAASAEHGNMSAIKVGDVMARRIKTNTNANGGASSSAVDASSSTSAPASPTTAILPTSTVEGSPTTRFAMKCFRRASDMTEEEQRYGRALHVDMLQQLFEVSRLDVASGTVEANFLDGSREKLRFFDIRPAGFQEQQLFVQWKTNPSSRPVYVIHASSPNASSPSFPMNASSPTSGEASPSSCAVAAADAIVWWVVPRLVVRIVAEGSGVWLGKKCEVRSVNRKDGSIRLHAASTDAPTSGEVIDVVGQDGLETVVPKKGSVGMVVLGQHRGELVRVCGRLRDAQGELSTVEVQPMNGEAGSTWQLAPHEVCDLATPPRR